MPSCDQSVFTQTIVFIPLKMLRQFKICVFDIRLARRCFVVVCCIIVVAATLCTVICCVHYFTTPVFHQHYRTLCLYHTHWHVYFIIVPYQHTDSKFLNSATLIFIEELCMISANHSNTLRLRYPYLYVSCAHITSLSQKLPYK